MYILMYVYACSFMLPIRCDCFIFGGLMRVNYSLDIPIIIALFFIFFNYSIEIIIVIVQSIFLPYYDFERIVLGMEYLLQ